MTNIKKLAGVLISTLIISVTAQSAFAGSIFYSIKSTLSYNEQKVSVKLDGKNITFPDVQPFVNEDNRTMVPVRFVSEALGCEVAWEESNELVTINKGQTRILLRIGENWAIVNNTSADVKKEFDTKAVLKNDRTMVPLRFVSETLGVGVAWDEVNNTVVLRSDGKVEVVVTPAPTSTETPKVTPSPVVTHSPTPVPTSTPTLLKIDLNEYPIFQEFAAIDGFKSASGYDAPWYKFGYGEINQYNNNLNNGVLAFDYNASDTGKKNTKKTNFYVDKYDEKNMDRFKKALSLIIPDAQEELYNLSVQYFGGKTETFFGTICNGKYEVYVRPFNNPQYPIEMQGAYIAVINGGQ